MSTDPASHPLVVAARELQPRIRAQAAQVEADGLVPSELIEALTDRGLFRMNIPAEAGGEQVDPLVVFHVLEALGHADASTAWVVMIATEISTSTGWLPGAVLSQMIGGDEPGGPRSRFAGSGRVLATGRRCRSGWRLSGQLNFCSGIEHATHVLVTFRDESDGAVHSAFLPQRAGAVVKTWDTMGLRGTGSHDWLIEDAYVQDAHAFGADRAPCAAGPIWRVPDRAVVIWIANAGHALGVAQGAIDEVVTASRAVASTMDARPLSERESFRVTLSRAQARVAAARAFVREAAGAAWESVLAGPIDEALLARWRMANVHAVHDAADAVELLFRAVGTNAIHRRWTLERRFRDLQVARQHGAGLDMNFDAAVRPMLGMESPQRRYR